MQHRMKKGSRIVYKDDTPVQHRLNISTCMCVARESANEGGA